MGIKSNRNKRKTNVHDPEVIRLRREGKLLLLTRKQVVTRILDTAIQMWFGDADPISVHILACVAHRNLHGFAKKLHKPQPGLIRAMKWDDVYSAYDHFRHNEDGGDPNHRDQFVVENNQVMLFDCVSSYGSTLSFRTPWMNTFGSYMTLHHGGKLGIHPKDRNDEFFPTVRVGEVIDLPRKAFVKKMYPLFFDAYKRGFH